MTRLELALAADRAQTDIALVALQAINELRLSRIAEHYAGFDRFAPPADLIDEMLGQTDADAQAWVEGRA